MHCNGDLCREVSCKGQMLLQGALHFYLEMTAIWLSPLPSSWLSQSPPVLLVSMGDVTR